MPDDVDTLTAGLAYGKAGWYLVPVRRGANKNPGSVVGKNWQTKSSRDPEQIVAWFAGTNYGIALHVGRSGAVAFDVDHPDAMPTVLAEELRDGVPMQRTRTDGDTRRGHWLFALPPDRMIGNSTGRLGGGWGDVRGRKGVFIVEPSEHAKADEGGSYRWAVTGPLPVLPPALDAALDQAADEHDAATDAEVSAFLQQHTDAAQAWLLESRLRGLAAKYAEGGSRHDATLPFTLGAMLEARAGCYPARVAVDRLREAFLTAMATSRPGSDRALSAGAASAEFDGILSWAVGGARLGDLGAVRARIAELAARLPEWDVLELLDGLDGGPAATDSVRLDELLTQLRVWVDGDLDHVIFALAVAVSAAETDGEPLWGMIVGAPSGGKTEALRLLDDVATDKVDVLTAAGLHYWRKVGKTQKPAGLLANVGNDPTAALVTIGDFSTLLSSSDKRSGSDKESLFDDLRRVYDGSLVRGGANGPEPLRWHGRLTLLAAVTGAIDAFTAHADALGPRWIYFRVPTVQRSRRRSSAARRGLPLTQRRAEACRLSGAVVRDARRRLPEVKLTDDMLDMLDAAAEMTAYARGSVPRDGYGRREIIAEPVIEEPYRLQQQLQQLVAALLALGLPTAEVERLAVQSALDTIPETRRKVLTAPAASSTSLSVSRLAAVAGVTERKVVRRDAEDLRAVGLTACPTEDNYDGDDPADLPTTRDWRLATGPLGDMARGVLAAQEARGGGTKQTDSTPSPPSIQRDSAGVTPFRPTPQPRQIKIEDLDEELTP